MISNSSLLLLLSTSLFSGCLVLTSMSVVSLASFVFLWKYFWNACSILAWFFARSLVMSSSGRLGMIGAGLKNNMSENKCQKCRDSRYPMRRIHTYEFVSSFLSHLSLSLLVLTFLHTTLNRVLLEWYVREDTAQWYSLSLWPWSYHWHELHLLDMAWTMMMNLLILLHLPLSSRPIVVRWSELDFSQSRSISYACHLWMFHHIGHVYQIYVL